MHELTASHIAEVCGGRVVGDPTARAEAISIDSRRLRAGEAFVAVRGGHDFVGAAVAAGAAFAVVERSEALPPRAAGVVVDDTVGALAALAREHRRWLDVVCVAVTGSTGKTLTKDMIAAALGTAHRVHAAPSSFNTEVTVPLVVLSCPSDAEVLVVELGARHAGEIADLASIVRPSIGVVTGVGVTHLSEFGSREAIARTKAELPASLPADGTAVLPAADDFLDLLAGSTAARSVTVGPGGSVRYEVLALGPDGRARVKVRTAAGEVDVQPPLPGRPFAFNAAVALGVAQILGVDLTSAARAVGAAPTSAWRMQVHRAGSRTLINDAYNANPTSMAAALRTARELAPGREAWAVLGAMAELGTASAAAHSRIGRLATSLGFRVVAVDAPDYGDRIVHVSDAEQAIDAVADACAPDAVVLVKASRSVGLELMAEALQRRWQSAGTGGRA